MNIDTSNLLNSILEELSSLSYVHPGDVPNINLYMDQVTTFMDEQLASTKRYPDDKILTKTMINNYTKNNLLPPPVKKKYSREHLLLLVFIYYFKNIQSDLTVSMPGFSMNGWILGVTTVDTSTASSDTESTIIGTVQLDKTNHWSYRWKDLETGDGITYSVTEQPVKGYTTTYQLNSSNIEAGTHFSLNENGDKVTITNTAEESGGYVLPSTGGAGTKLYTAGGGALMLAALVCWVCRKRRRERRAR